MCFSPHPIHCTILLGILAMRFQVLFTISTCPYTTSYIKKWFRIRIDYIAYITASGYSSLWHSTTITSPIVCNTIPLAAVWACPCHIFSPFTQSLRSRSSERRLVYLFTIQLSHALTPDRIKKVHGRYCLFTISTVLLFSVNTL